MMNYNFKKFSISLNLLFGIKDKKKNFVSDFEKS